jgi:hypothetical protein
MGPDGARKPIITVLARASSNLTDPPIERKVGDYFFPELLV